MQFCDPYGWHDVGESAILEIRGKLAEFEKQTWREIFITAKKRNHVIAVASLCPQARKEARRIAPDLEELHTLRLAGKQRIWGIFSSGIFEIIWWDPFHRVYPVGPDAENSN